MALMMTIVYSSLYEALRSVNVPAEMAEKAAAIHSPETPSNVGKRAGDIYILLSAANLVFIFLTLVTVLHMKSG
jgi:hypothetical protein